MGTQLSRLGIVVTGDTSDANAKLQSTLNTIAGFSGLTAGITVAQATWDGLQQAIDFAADSLRAFQDIAGRVGAIDDFAKKLNIDPQILQALGRGAEHEGASFEKLTNGIDKYNAVLGDALNGSESAAKAFDDLGLSADALASMDLEQALAQVADRLNDFGGAQRQSLGEAVFGKGFRDLDLFFQSGSEGIQGWIDQFGELKMGFTALQSEAIQAADDALNDVYKQFEAIAVTLAADLAPFLQVMAESLTEFLASQDFATLSVILQEVAGLLYSVGSFVKLVADQIEEIIKKIPYHKELGLTFQSPDFQKLVEKARNDAAAATAEREAKRLEKAGPKHFLGFQNPADSWGGAGDASINGPNGPGRLGTAGALEVGTAAAYRAAYQALTPKEDQQKKANDLAKEGNKKLDDIKKAMEKAPRLVMVK